MNTCQNQFNAQNILFRSKIDFNLMPKYYILGQKLNHPMKKSQLEIEIQHSFYTMQLISRTTRCREQANGEITTKI